MESGPDTNRVMVSACLGVASLPASTCGTQVAVSRVVTFLCDVVAVFLLGSPSDTPGTAFGGSVAFRGALRAVLVVLAGAVAAAWL